MLFFPLGAAHSLSWDHGHVTWDFHTMASSYLNPLIYVVWIWDTYLPVSLSCCSFFLRVARCKALCRIKQESIGANWRPSFPSTLDCWSRSALKTGKYNCRNMGTQRDVDVDTLLMKLTLTGAWRNRISARMSGFVRHCVITKECPETFLLFLYKTPLFPRFVQVLRICFLSLSLSLSLCACLPFSPSLSLSLPLSVCGDTRTPQRLVYNRTTIHAQCLQGCKEQESMSAENVRGRNIQIRVVSYFQLKSNRRFLEANTPHSRVEWTF